MTAEYIIRVENLTHCYSNGFKALENISFDITSGELTAIIGQNGAGKTTLVKHLNGLLQPTRGKIIVGGINTHKQKISTLAKKVGYVFQNPDHQIFKDTVYSEVAFGPINLGLNQKEVNQRVTEAIAAVGLADFESVSPQNLSKGQRQRVALASVLAMRTDVIVLDEPTTGQDYKESLQIMDLVKELNDAGHTILFITHDMNLVARYARRAIVLCKGEILLDGTVQEVFSQGEKLKQTYLHPPQILELAGRFQTQGIPQDILTPEDFYQYLLSASRGVKDVCCG